jgi:deoxyadenosine/deoxycytidine kinase
MVTVFQYNEMITLPTLSSQQEFQELIQKIVNFLEDKNNSFDKTIFAKDINKLPYGECLLCTRLLDLYQYKIHPAKVSPKGKFIGFFGPLGVGKTTLASLLTEYLGAQFIVKEPYLANPFWQHSQTDSTFMFRSQIYFLLSNIVSDIEATAQDGIAISDTSTLTDIVMWAEWYYEIGHLQKDEYDLYKRIVGLLKEIIPVPTLLVTLLPNSVEGLMEGIEHRQEAEEDRKGELTFSQEDLSQQIQRVQKAHKKITKDWNCKMITLHINSLDVFTDQDLQSEYLQRVIDELA